jgi:hypothetical protein
MSFAVVSLKHAARNHWLRWFLCGGFAGLLVSVMFIVTQAPVSSYPILFPTAAMIFDPSDSGGIGWTFFIFGGQFALYGSAGMMMGFVLRAVRGPQQG